MGITKKLNWHNIFSLESLFLFLFLVAFPFGQIIRLNFYLVGLTIPLQPVDIIVGCAGVYALIKRFLKPVFFRSVVNFLFAALFAFVFSIFVFKSADLVYGFFYFIRLAAYFYFLVYVWNFAKRSKVNVSLLKDCLLGISVVSAVFGWIQFFTFPDIKPFFVWGWDMHLFRLVGTFLDPTFLGLILVFGLVISIYRYINKRDWKNILIAAFLFVSLAFTYSRASYLAFAVAILAIIYIEKKFKKLLLLILGLVVIVLLLPTARNHSIELFRSFSVIARLVDYRLTLKIFSASPVFGIGYDNMCLAYQKFIGFQDFSSHSCSGSDSSLLFVLTTTGAVGFMIFLDLIRKIGSSLSRSVESKIFIVSFMALLIHSLFSNSIFYPWIMGYIVILLAVSLKE
ncbi:MAG: O-antigen ligase family protein [Candidatus Microgenomates bacterium]|jgi:O-antigen ligase